MKFGAAVETGKSWSLAALGRKESMAGQEITTTSDSAGSAENTPVPLPTEAQIAWLAGLFEGEGCAELRMHGRYGPYAAITIQMTDLDVLEQCQQWFGGKIQGPYQNLTPKADGTPRKTQWAWRIARTEDVARTVKLILPWMKERRSIKLLKILDAVDGRVDGRTVARTVSED